MRCSSPGVPGRAHARANVSASRRKGWNPAGSVRNRTGKRGSRSRSGMRHGSAAWARNASESRITCVMYFVARRTASIATSKQSVAVAAASTASGASALRPWTACSRSDCSAFVGMPVEGPARWEFTTTRGSSVAIARPSISVLSAMPGPEVDVTPNIPAYAGMLGVTSTSGPGMALKTEMLGLAIATELPLVVVNSQRAGPSTGMPTKAEQSDLLQAVHGRNADAPLAVLAAATATDCFDVAIEAVRLATKYMTHVILLSDAFLAHAAEPWRIPDLERLPRFPVRFRTEPAGFHPFLRDAETLARAWARPGTPGLEHRIGGLEKDYDTGHISYDPENHARMTRARADKIAGIANDIPPQSVSLGADHGAIAVVGWGSTYGAIHQAVRRARQDGVDASHIHLRYLSPFPRNLGELLKRFDRVLVPELNNGQLVQLLRATYLVPAEGLNKVQGKPFKVSEIAEAIR